MNDTDPLKRLCRLCGKPLGKHVAPPYGTKSEQIGAMGLMCPTDTRAEALSDDLRNGGEK